MTIRLVAAFRGSAQCRRELGAVQWCLSGLDRDSGDVLEVRLSGAAGLELSPQLAAAELFVRDEPAGSVWELRSGTVVLPLPVRAVQVHRSAAAVFARALPPAVVPWSVRSGWAVLLNALRVPGLARLLGRLANKGDAP